MTNAERLAKSIEARLATAMELLKSAQQDLSRLGNGKVHLDQEKISAIIHQQREQEVSMPSAEHEKLFAMIEGRKTGRLLSDIHIWASKFLDWDEESTNEALTKLVELSLLKEPSIGSDGIMYLCNKKVEKGISDIEPKLLVMIMEELVCPMPLDRVRDTLATTSDGWTTPQVRAALKALRTDGYVIMTGSRRGAKWEKVKELPSRMTNSVLRLEQDDFEPELHRTVALDDLDIAIGDDEEGLDDLPEESEEEEYPEIKEKIEPAKMVLRKPSSDEDWNVLLLEALDANGGEMDFEELVSHCNHYGEKYGFTLSTTARDFIFNNLTRAMTRMMAAGMVTQEGQSLVLVDHEAKDDDEGDEEGDGEDEGDTKTRGGIDSLLRAEALEQYKVNPKGKKKGNRNVPVTLPDWAWLLYDVLNWAYEERRASAVTIGNMVVILAQEPQGLDWTVSGVPPEQVVRSLKAALPVALSLYPDIEVVTEDDDPGGKKIKKYRISPE